MSNIDIAATDAIGTMTDVRINLVDVDCGTCMDSHWFQLADPEHRNGGAEAVLVCCGCGEPLLYPEVDDDES